MYNIPHGIVCGTLMASSNEVIVARLRHEKNNPQTLRKYSFLGKLFLVDKDKNDDYFIDGFIEYLHGMTNDLKLPDLRKSGVKEKDLKEIALITECKNNPVKLSPEDLIEILYKRFI